jgi:hypothetical protein
MAVIWVAGGMVSRHGLTVVPSQALLLSAQPVNCDPGQGIAVTMRGWPKLT